MATFKQINGGFYRQDDNGHMYAVTDKDTITALKSGQIQYNSEPANRALTFADSGSPSLSGAMGNSQPANTSTTGGDFASILKGKISKAMTDYKGVTDVSGLESKRQELLRKQLISAPYQASSEGVLTGAQKLSLMRDQGKEYEPLIKSIEEQITSAKSGDENAINAITKLASVASALGIDVVGNGGGFKSPLGKEYNDYVADETSKGNNKVMTLNEYATFDANRKRAVTNINNAGLNTQMTNTALKLSDDYEARSKDFYVVRDGYNRVVSAAKDPSAAGDIALIFSYMKTLDPNSVVRETEFATAENAGSVPERIRSQYNKVVAGERLSQVMRTDFADRSKRLYEAAKSQQDRVVEEFGSRADKFGIPRDLVVRETTANDSYDAPASTSKIPADVQTKIRNNMTFSADKKTVYITRSVWATLGEYMDDVIKEAKDDGVELLVK